MTFPLRRIQVAARSIAYLEELIAARGVYHEPDHYALAKLKAIYGEAIAATDPALLTADLEPHADQND